MGPGRGRPVTEEEIRSVVRDTALEIMELTPQELDDDTGFEAAGGTSLQRLELIAALQDRLGVQYTLDDEVAITSVQAAVDITRRALEI